jgi:hypothetical protein
MKTKLNKLFALALVAMTFAWVGCSEEPAFGPNDEAAASTNQHAISLISAGILNADGDYVWSWSVSKGAAKNAISHIGFIDLGGCAALENIVSASYTINGSTTPVTLKWAIDKSQTAYTGMTLKFDAGADVIIYTMVVNQKYDVGTNQVVMKAGSKTPAYIATFDGIGCFHIGGTVTATNCEDGQEVTGPVASATVTMGGLTATTSSTGAYLFTDVKGGEYTLSVGGQTSIVTLPGSVDNADFYFNNAPNGCGTTPPPTTCSNETSYAGGVYVNNAASENSWFYYFDMTGKSTESGTLYAGKTNAVGSVTITRNDNGTYNVDVTLNDGASLQSGDNFYVDVESSVPTARGSSGHYGVKLSATGSSFSTNSKVGDAGDYVKVHVNVRMCK